MLCLALTHCTPTQPPQSTSAAVYNPLKTPPHSMRKWEYPFDEGGRYRKDWVKAGSEKKASTSTVASSGQSHTYGSRSTASVPVQRSSSTSASSSRSSSTSSKPIYHKVVKGDTLYSISRRYGIGLSELKRKNGLTGDLIRTGQSLRIR